MRFTPAVLAVAVSAACRAGESTSPAGAEALEFAALPLQATACERIAPLAVRATTNGGLAAAATGAVTVSVVSGTGTPLAVLSGTRTMPLVAGVATFTDLSLNLPGADYRLAATVTTGATSAPASRAALSTADGASVFADATSAPIAVVAGGPTHLAFTTTLVSTVAGVTLPPVRVTIRDACQGAVNTASNAVTIALGTNATGAELAGTTTVAAVNGVATFTNLWVNRPGAGYTFVATAAGLSLANSNAFTVAGTP